MLALLLAAVATAAPVTIMVVKMPTEQQRLATVWDSAASQKDCIDAKIEAARAMVDQVERDIAIGSLGKATPTPTAEPAVCTEGTIAKLTRGTEVEILEASEACGKARHVRILSGKYEGKTGCLSSSFLEEKPTPKPVD